jgi:hypothetical protein
MSYPFNYPTPQNANVQIFNCSSNTTTVTDWVKPQGVSFVWFTLIGAGGGGCGSSVSFATSGQGGGSGALTNCLAPAFILPDVLRVLVGPGGAGGIPIANDGGTGTTSTVSYYTKSTNYAFLSAAGGGGGFYNGSGGAGGVGTNPQSLAPAVMYSSTSGQTGGNTSAPLSSTTTPLTGGNCGAVSGAYGYSNGGGTNNNGFFQFSPILVGVGGAFNSVAAPYKGGIGCGGNALLYTTDEAITAGAGGPGAVVIISW